MTSTQAIEIPKWYQPKFTTIQEDLLQKEGSYLMPCVAHGSYRGESGEVVKQWGQTTARRGNEDRNGDTPVMTTPVDQRWVYPETIDWGDMISKADDLRMLVDRQSGLVKAANMAMGRQIDGVIIDAFFGASKTGKNGTTTTNFPAGQEVASSFGGSTVGLTVEKVIESRRILRANYAFGRERAFFGITSKQESDLLNSTKFINRDYGEPQLDSGNGRLKNWLGYEWVILEEFPITGTVRECPVWLESGIHLGMWDALSTNIGPDPGKKFNVRVYMSQMMGATRTQEKKVVRVKCSEA